MESPDKLINIINLLYDNMDLNDRLIAMMFLDI